MEIISTIGTALTILTRLREVSKTIDDAEIKNLVADLSLQLAELKLEAASLKVEIADLKAENQELRKKKKTDEKPSGTKFGCYIFDGDEGLYCTACWDMNNQKSLTSRVTSKFRNCPVCKATFGR